MTDDNVRPETDPSRDPESHGPGEPGGEGSMDAVESSGSTVEPGGARDEVAAAEPAIIGDVNADVAVAPEGDTDAADHDDLSVAAEPAPIAESKQAAEPEQAAEQESPVEAVPEDEPVAVTTEPDGIPAPGPEPDAVGVSAAVRDDAFTWHPEHKGKTFDEVRATLAQDIAADQRQHRLAMDGAEESEHEALASVVSLERKWGPYDFDWAEQEPEELADRILDFERERERRQEMISWSDYRNAGVETSEALADGERAPELSTPAKGLSLLLVVLLIVVILLAVWAL